MILVKGNAAFNSGKTLKVRMGKDLEIEVEGDAKMLVKGNMTSEVKGNYLHKVGGSCTIASNSNMILVAPRIDLNPEGESATSINTFLEKSRSFVNGMMQKLKDVAVAPKIAQQPLPPPIQNIAEPPKSPADAPTPYNPTTKTGRDPKAQKIYNLADPLNFSDVDDYVEAHKQKLEELVTKGDAAIENSLPTYGQAGSFEKASDQALASRSRQYVKALQSNAPDNVTDAIERRLDSILRQTYFDANR
jgi:hypothetical protein